MRKGDFKQGYFFSEDIPSKGGMGLNIMGSDFVDHDPSGRRRGRVA